MDTIKVQGIEFFAYHGLFEEEAKNGQKFMIDCEFKLDTSGCREEIEKTVHYGEVTMDIVAFATENRYDLLETLANDLVKYILEKYSLMDELTLTIHKPNAPIPATFTDVSLTITRRRTTVFLGIGSNLGDKKEYLDMVSSEIKNHKHMEFVKKSSYVTTPPYGVLDQPDFLNGVIKFKTYLTAFELLEFTQELEKKAGRIHTRKWGERTLDVDILLYGDDVLYSDTLKIPHPELELRKFVLEPLCEIDPYFVHPVLKFNLINLLNSLN